MARARRKSSRYSLRSPAAPQDPAPLQDADAKNNSCSAQDADAQTDAQEQAADYIDTRVRLPSAAQYDPTTGEAWVWHDGRKTATGWKKGENDSVLATFDLGFAVVVEIPVQELMWSSVEGKPVDGDRGKAPEAKKAKKPAEKKAKDKKPAEKKAKDKKPAEKNSDTPEDKDFDMVRANAFQGSVVKVKISWNTRKDTKTWLVQLISASQPPKQFAQLTQHRMLNDLPKAVNCMNGLATQLEELARTDKLDLPSLKKQARQLLDKLIEA